MFTNSTASRTLYVDEELPASSSRRGRPLPKQTPLACGTVIARRRDQHENCLFSGLLSVVGTAFISVIPTCVMVIHRGGWDFFFFHNERKCYKEHGFVGTLKQASEMML